MVSFHEVTVSFGTRTVLHSLSLTVPEGDSLALWGHNGAGKSTAFNAVLDLVPFTGRITVAGKDNRREGAAVRRLIGWAPQDLALSDLSVKHILEFTGSLREASLPPAWEYLRSYGLENLVENSVSQLSGGERRRLSVALALVGEPPILLLDEPTANLDQTARRQLLALLKELKQKGKTLVWASHVVEDIAVIADRVAVFEEGRLIRVIPAGRFAESDQSGPDQIEPQQRTGKGDRSFAGE